MKESELISLLGYYMGIMVFVYAFFANFIESWKNKVEELSNEWDITEQKTNSQFKIHQNGQRKTLNKNTPYFSLLVPIIISIVLGGLGLFSLFKADSTVNKCDYFILLILPIVILLLAHIWYGLITIGKCKELLKSLK